VKTPFKKSTLTVALSLLITLIVLAPASIKAHKISGSWMVSNSSMFNLWLGIVDDKRQNFSHDQGGPIYQQYMKLGENFEQRNEQAKQKALSLIKDKGYLSTLISQLGKQYFRLFDYQSFFSQHFQGDRQDNYLNRYSHRVDEPMVMVLLAYNTFFYFVIMVGLLLGMVYSFKHSLIAKQFMFFFLYVLALFVLLHTKSRFRIPLMPLMAFYSAYLVKYYCQVKSLAGSVRVAKSRQLLINLLLTVMSVLFFLFSAHFLDKHFPI
jgi:hypothetical protein